MRYSSVLALGVIAVTGAAVPLRAQDTTVHRDTVRKDTVPPAATLPPTVSTPVPVSPPAPTIEQIRYMEGLRTATRGIAQIRDGLSRVTRTQQADSLTRRRAARRLGGLCTAARTFIASGRPKMQAAAYTDSLGILAKRLTTRLDSLSKSLPTCEQTAGRDPTTVTTDLTKQLTAYDEALLAFRNAQAALNKPDSSKTVSQQ